MKDYHFLKLFFILLYGFRETMSSYWLTLSDKLVTSHHRNVPQETTERGFQLLIYLKLCEKSYAHIENHRYADICIICLLKASISGILSVKIIRIWCKDFNPQRISLESLTAKAYITAICIFTVTETIVLVNSTNYAKIYYKIAFQSIIL